MTEINQHPEVPYTRIRKSPYLPRLEKNIGYATVPIEFAEVGTEVAVEPLDERPWAVVVPKSFIDPQKEIPRQDLAAAAAEDD